MADDGPSQTYTPPNMMGPPICEGGYIYVIYEYETPLCAFTVNVWVDTEAMKKFEEFRMGADFDNLRIRKGVLPEKSEICVPANTPEKIALYST